MMIRLEESDIGDTRPLFFVKTRTHMPVQKLAGVSVGGGQVSLGGKL